MAVAVPFPSVQPPGYTWLDAEPTFDPDLHLALEEPEEVISLAELGYSCLLYTSPSPRDRG